MLKKQEIERVLRMRIGEEVSIPILLIDEKNELLASLITKADQVTKLKADLVDDLSGLVDLLGALPKSWKPLPHIIFMQI